MSNNPPTSKDYLKDALNQECIRRTGYPLDEDDWKEFCRDYSFLFKVLDNYKNTPDDITGKNKNVQQSKNKSHRKHRSRSRKRQGSVGSEIPKRDH